MAADDTSPDGSATALAAATTKRCASGSSRSNVGLHQAATRAAPGAAAVVQPDTTPAQGGIVGLLGRSAWRSRRPATDTLSPAQRERAGLRALGDFGTSLMAGSGYYPGKPMFGGLAQGFEGAARSEAGREQQAASYLGAQQNWQMEQQKLQMERLKEALPLLQMQYRGEPSPTHCSAPTPPPCQGPRAALGSQAGAALPGTAASPRTGPPACAGPGQMCAPSCSRQAAKRLPETGALPSSRPG